MFEQIGNIGKLFPDTPIKLVTDVCRALQLYDLAELLEKAAKPRTLRPALPLKEIAKLPSDSNRPTTFYSKVNIMLVVDGDETFDTIGNVFKNICPGSKITRVKPVFNARQLQRNVQLAEDRRQILRAIRNLEQYIDEDRASFRGLRERMIALDKHKDEIDKQLLLVNGELKEKEKKIEADISSAFDKSWGGERGKICIS